MCVCVCVCVCQTSWETVGKRRSVGKEAGPSEIKERRGGEREASRVRGGANRRGRGISRGRDGNYAGRAGVSKGFLDKH